MMVYRLKCLQGNADGQTLVVSTSTVAIGFIQQGHRQVSVFGGAFSHSHSLLFQLCETFTVTIYY